MPDIRKKTLAKQWRKSKKKPKIVIDTNLCVSGLLTSGLPAKLIEGIPRRKFSLVISQEIFLEYSRVLNRFPKITKTVREKLLGKIRYHAEWVRPKEKIDIVKKDPTDNKFVECAVTAQADFIITRDKPLLEIETYKNVAIVSLSDFEDIVGKM